MNKSTINTVVLLSLGYFIDFYDLSIFSVNYSKIIPDLFGITNEIAIQMLYLKITNCYNVGIIIGCIIFGILGDKFGRTSVIKVSIILYSSAIFLSIFTHNILVFTILRTISGIGLATEFSTSSILISELLNDSKKTNVNIAILYLSGIFGGITATFIGWFSWKWMFLFGSIFGVIIYILRTNMFESELYINIQNKNYSRGNIISILNNKKSLLKILKLFFISTPFYFLISVIFIIPKFINLNINLMQSIHLLLVYFFIGNIIGVLLSWKVIKKLQNYKKIMYGSLILFTITLLTTRYINNELYIIYCLILGIVGGCVPVVWIQLVIKHFGTNQRNTATNLLTALGRASTIIYNTLISFWIHKDFLSFVTIATIFTTIFVAISLFTTDDKYSHKIDFIQ